MAAQSLVIACSSTPAAVAGTFGGGAVHGYIRVQLKSIAGVCYLGSSSVTTAGYPLTSADASIQETLITGESLWVASSSGATATLAILRTAETT